ncbi:MAG TPA: DUF4012 domain-containing protein, partial [Actinomycetota bacterium]|nr:DUF4012 domain-containing protein [Actinomycetota bacterium]
GIPSGAGTIVADGGKLTLGQFRHTVSLRGKKPYERVPAPAEFSERFGQFDADTTFWTNTTFSPDVPDVALVARRLYRAVMGTETHGVIIIDPRGIAALLPERAEIRVPVAATTVDRHSLADFVYAGAYERLGGQGPRRDVLIELGERAFSEILSGGLRTEDDLLAAIRSARAGHIRIVPLHEEERALLEAAGVTGDLEEPESDHLLVATQNSGGDKLDYWIQRHVEHSCRIEPAYADCSGSATFENLVPDHLTRYVAGRPYGRAHTFAEIYLPADADVTSIEIDGVPAPVFAAEQAGHFVAGLELTIPQGEVARASWSYRLPIERSYSITISPQPLARDATVAVRLQAPRRWAFDGPGDRAGNEVVYEGVLDSPLRIDAQPSGRRGIPAVWDRLVRFWREPVF